MPRLKKQQLTQATHRCKFCGGTDIEAVDEFIVIEDDVGKVLLCTQLFPDTRDGVAYDPEVNWRDSFPLPIGHKTLYLLVHNGLFSATFLKESASIHGYFTILATDTGFPARLVWRGLVPSRLETCDEVIEYVRAQVAKARKEVATASGASEVPLP